MKALTFCLALLAAPACAGTLTINWVDTSPDGAALDPFVFSVPRLDTVGFAYTGVIEETWPSSTETATYNPYDATLISKPTDDLYWGVERGWYEILIRPAGVRVDGYLASIENRLGFDPKHLSVDINQGQFGYGYDGYWTATYVANSPEEGQSFEVLAPIPLPASLPLLAVGIVALGGVRMGRSRRQWKA